MKKIVFLSGFEGFYNMKTLEKNNLLFRKKKIFDTVRSLVKYYMVSRGINTVSSLKKNQLLVNIHRRKYNKNFMASPAKKLALLIKMFYSLF